MLQARNALGAAVAELDTALTLWRGTPLGGAAGPFVDAERDRLGELRFHALGMQWDEPLPARGTEPPAGGPGGGPARPAGPSQPRPLQDPPASPEADALSHDRC